MAAAIPCVTCKGNFFLPWRKVLLLLGLAEAPQQCGRPQGHLLGVTCQAQTPPVQQLWLSAMARQGCRDGAKLSLADPGSGSMAR